MYKLSQKEISNRALKRGAYPEGVRWYAAMTHCGRECGVADRIAKRLAAEGVEEALAPEYIGQDRAGAGRGVILFASYMFLRCRMTDEIYMKAAADPDVFKILGEAWRIPSPIDDSEMRHLKGLLSACEKPELVHAIEAGDEVELTAGMMKGMRGRVVGRNGNNIKLQTRFSFLDPGSAVCVIVPRSQVKLLIGDLIDRMNEQLPKPSEMVEAL